MRTSSLGVTKLHYASFGPDAETAFLFTQLLHQPIITNMLSNQCFFSIVCVCVGREPRFPHPCGEPEAAGALERIGSSFAGRVHFPRSRCFQPSARRSRIYPVIAKRTREREGEREQIGFTGAHFPGSRTSRSH